jgi:hypothetical protein
MSKPKDETALNQQVEELREKMRVLRTSLFILIAEFLFLFSSVKLSLENDRRTNIDVLESNKAQNKEDIKRMRIENKQLREKYVQLQLVNHTVLYGIVKENLLHSFIFSSSYSKRQWMTRKTSKNILSKKSSGCDESTMSLS